MTGANFVYSSAALSSHGLSDNGGPSATIALRSGSPAINAGTLSALPAGTVFDQRGGDGNNAMYFFRVVNQKIDIGACQTQSATNPIGTITVTAPKATEGSPVPTTNVATFTVSNNTAPGSLVAAVSTGSETLFSNDPASGVSVTANNNVFTVTLSGYTYYWMPTAMFTVTINGGGLALRSGQIASSVIDPPLAATPVTVKPQIGVATGLVTVATFTDAGNPLNIATSPQDDYSGTISWGDGTATDTGGAVKIVFDSANRVWDVQGSHTYATAGTKQIAVTAYDGLTNFTTVQSTARVGLPVPTVVVSDAGGSYKGSAYGATATVNGAASLEGVSPALSYYVGSGTSGTSLGNTAPSDAGTYTAVATFPGSADYSMVSVQATFTIAQATPTVVVTDAGGTYSGTPCPATAIVTGLNGLLNGSTTCTYYVGNGTAGTNLGNTAPSAAGTYTVVANFAGSTDYAPASGQATFTITQAIPTVAVVDAGGVYQGGAYPAAATVNGAASLENVTATLTYYAGNGTGGANLGNTPPSAAGTYTVVANFAGGTDYTSASGQATFTITQAPPTLAVIDAGGPYTGNPYPAMATVNGGASLEGVSPTLTYYVGNGTSGTSLGSPPPSAMGTYTVVAAFAGSTDYTIAGAETTFTISKGVPTVVVSDPGGTYIGNAYPATAAVNGAASLEGVSPALIYYVGSGTGGTNLGGTAPSDAGTYTAVAFFPGSASFGSASGQAVFTIARATPTVSVTDAGGTYSGSPYPAAATVTGLAGSLIASTTCTYYVGSGTGGRNLGNTAPSAAGTYTVVANFAGSTDYTSASGQAAFTIAQATPAVAVTDAGGVYKASAYPATATINGGASLEGVSPALSYYVGSGTGGTSLGNTAPSDAGTYTAVATFPGSTNYSTASGQTTFTIAQATPNVSVTDAGGVYAGTPYPATAIVTGLNGLLNGSTTFTYYVGNGTGGRNLGSTAPSAAGTYTVAANFAGSTDYTSASGQATFTITQATPTVAVVDAGGAYKGSPYPATATVNGAASLENVTATLTYYAGNGTGGANLGNTAPSAAGTYTVVANFAGGTDYTSASGQATFTITQATPTVVVTDGGGPYTGNPYPATATVNGGANLEGVSPTLTYYAGSDTSGTNLGSLPPSAQGTYTVVAAFGGSTDYIIAGADHLHHQQGGADRGGDRHRRDLHRQRLPGHGHGQQRSQPGGREPRIDLLRRQRHGRNEPGRSSAQRRGHVHGGGLLPRQRELRARQRTGRLHHRPGGADGLGRRRRWDLFRRPLPRHGHRHRPQRLAQCEHDMYVLRRQRHGRPEPGQHGAERGGDLYRRGELRRQHRLHSCQRPGDLQHRPGGAHRLGQRRRRRIQRQFLSGHGHDQRRRQPGERDGDFDLLRRQRHQRHEAGRHSAQRGGHVHRGGQFRRQHRLHSRQRSGDLHHHPGDAHRGRRRCRWRVQRQSLSGHGHRQRRGEFGRRQCGANLLRRQWHGRNEPRRHGAQRGGHIHRGGQLRRQHRLHSRQRPGDLHHHPGNAHRGGDRRWRAVYGQSVSGHGHGQRRRQPGRRQSDADLLRGQ